MLPEDRAALFAMGMWLLFVLLICALMATQARATRGCAQRDGCPTPIRYGFHRVPPPLPVFKTPEEAATAIYMLERWPVEPIYRMRGE